jgi:NAD(P)H-dependent FMN reductase
MKLLGICGSLQANSSNLTLLNEAAALVPDGISFSIYSGIESLPFFNPDLEAAGTPPAVSAFREALLSADGVFIASPEYGFSLPGSLKNAIDWVIGSGELSEKPVAVTASVASIGRGQRGLKALLVTLGAVGARVVGGEPIVKGAGAHSDLVALLGALIDMASSATAPSAPSVGL